MEVGVYVYWVITNIILCWIAFNVGCVAGELKKMGGSK
jgi:hypothetical protein